MIYSPLKTTRQTFRLIYVSVSDESNLAIEHTCKQLMFLTKLVRCTLDEIFFKQMECRQSLIFEIEKQIHHLPMSNKDFQDKNTDQEIFKEIYRQIYTTDLAQDSTVKLIINSSISSTITFASSSYPLIDIL